MRQVLVRKGAVRVADVPTALLDQGQILVDVRYSLISAGTEMSSVVSSSQSLAQKALQQPDKVKKVLELVRRQGLRLTIDYVQSKMAGGTGAATGYSCAGVVVQVAEDVTDVHPGDRVACAGAGVANHADWVLVPRNLAVRVPEAVSLRDSCATTVGAIAMQGVRQADVRLGETVAVIGLGLVGQLTVQLLKAAGCRVLGFDLDQRRIELARTHGAELAYNSVEDDPQRVVLHATAGHGVDSTIICASTSSNAVAQQAIEITRKRGRVVVVGAVGLGIDRSPFYEKEIEFTISCSYGPGRYDADYEQQGHDYPYAFVRWTENRNMQAFLQLVASGAVALEHILEAEYALDDVEQAYAALAAPSRPLGVVLRYEDKEPAVVRRQIAEPRQHQGLIRVGLIGAGGFARAVHLPNLKRLSDSYVLRGVASGQGVNALSAGEQFGAEYVATDYHELLDDPDIDLIMICTRHDLHASLAIDALRAGKAVFVEKPLATTRQDAELVLETARETGLPYMVGFNRRFSPAVVRARALLADRQNPMMVNYRVNAGYVPPEHWTQTSEGGGRMVGEGCHMLDVFQALVSPALAVDAVSTSIAPDSEHLLPSDNMVLTVRYSDGSVCNLVYASIGAAAAGKELVEIHTDGMTLVIDDYTSLTVYGSKRKGWAGAQDKGHLQELEALARCLKGEKQLPIPLDELSAVTRISLGA